MGNKLQIRVPDQCEIISSDIMGGTIILWVLHPWVDTTIALPKFVDRKFLAVATEELIEIPEGQTITFISSFLLPQDKIIHLFEFVNKK